MCLVADPPACWSGITSVAIRATDGLTALLPSMPAVYYVDTALLAELRATERQCAEELGQWVTKSEPSQLNVNEMTERLNAGRRRARRLGEKAGA